MCFTWWLVRLVEKVIKNASLDDICPFIHLTYVVSSGIMESGKFFKDTLLIFNIYFVFDLLFSLRRNSCSPVFYRCFIFGCRSVECKDSAAQNQNDDCLILISIPQVQIQHLEIRMLVD